MLIYGRLKRATKPDKEGNFKSREHEKKVLVCALKLLARDPLIESRWTGKGLLLFEDNYTDRMFNGLLHATKRNRPEAMRKAAVQILGSLKRPEAEDFLLDVLNDRNASTELHEMAKFALIKMEKGQPDVMKKRVMLKGGKLMRF